MSSRSVLLGAGLIATMSVTSALAQGYTPPQSSYGYQPYNDRNPTGFMHPNNTGYGQYVYSPKTTGHRSPALKYRRFRGY